ncbi:MAG: antibiotic biosynthesis monooxygenase family protein [Parvularculaceae bacterium]
MTSGDDGEFCYAVIFQSTLKPGVADDYGDAAARMAQLSRAMPGFLGIESARGADGVGITVCYWESEAAIAAWRAEAEHRAAQARGAREWYADYRVSVAKVLRTYGSSATSPADAALCDGTKEERCPTTT